MHTKDPQTLVFSPENLRQSHGKCSQLLRNAELIGKVLLSADGRQKADIQIPRTIFRQLLFIREFAFCSPLSYPLLCLGFLKKHSPCPWYFVLHVGVEVLVVRGSRSGRDEKEKLQSGTEIHTSACGGLQTRAGEKSEEEGEGRPNAINWPYTASPSASFTSLCASGWGRGL